MTLTVCQTIDFCQQARKDARAWHSMNGTHSPESLDNFDAGFKDGWAQCLRTLKLHGYKFDDPRSDRNIYQPKPSSWSPS